MPVWLKRYKPPLFPLAGVGKLVVTVTPPDPPLAAIVTVLPEGVTVIPVPAPIDKAPVSEFSEDTPPLDCATQLRVPLVVLDSTYPFVLGFPSADSAPIAVGEIATDVFAVTKPLALVVI